MSSSALRRWSRRTQPHTIASVSNYCRGSAPAIRRHLRCHRRHGLRWACRLARWRRARSRHSSGSRNSPTPLAKYRRRQRKLRWWCLTARPPAAPVYLMPTFATILHRSVSTSRNASCDCRNEVVLTFSPCLRTARLHSTVLASLAATRVSMHSRWACPCSRCRAISCAAAELSRCCGPCQTMCQHR